jgi:hypothetical protein
MFPINPAPDAHLHAHFTCPYCGELLESALRTREIDDSISFDNGLNTYFHLECYQKDLAGDELDRALPLSDQLSFPNI